MGLDVYLIGSVKLREDEESYIDAGSYGIGCFATDNNMIHEFTIWLFSSPVQESVT
jgi:hypothetical protein